MKNLHIYRHSKRGLCRSSQKLQDCLRTEFKEIHVHKGSRVAGQVIFGRCWFLLWNTGFLKPGTSARTMKVWTRGETGLFKQQWLRGSYIRLRMVNTCSAWRMGCLIGWDIQWYSCLKDSFSPCELSGSLPLGALGAHRPNRWCG